MPIKDTDRKARANYLKKTEQLNFVLYPSEQDIKDRLEQRVALGEAKTSYIKRLIREDILRDAASKETK